MIYLEIPMHKDLTSFMFYEVLSILCRYECETSHRLIQKRRRELNKILFVAQAFKGSNPSPSFMKHLLNLRMRSDE